MSLTPLKRNVKLSSLSYQIYEMQLATKQDRKGFWIRLESQEGGVSWGEVSPLPLWSTESTEEALHQFLEIKTTLLDTEWKEDSLFSTLSSLHLYPSLLFGLESALLTLLSPRISFSQEIKTSALFLGSYTDILERAEKKEREGIQSAKLKIGHLSIDEAYLLVRHLKDRFSLRIDVNRSWKTKEVLQFFSSFPKTSFDYVEEPMQHPQDLPLFSHPLAIDESFPKEVSLSFLETLPHLKALVYKPTIQGGITNCLPIYEWTKKRKIQLVLSSSFETLLGIQHIIHMASYLSLPYPLGIGTSDWIASPPFYTS